jgi:hypothetical protein
MLCGINRPGAADLRIYARYWIGIELNRPRTRAVPASPIWSPHRRRAPIDTRSKDQGDWEPAALVAVFWMLT